LCKQAANIRRFPNLPLFAISETAECQANVAETQLTTGLVHQKKEENSSSPLSVMSLARMGFGRPEKILKGDQQH